MGDTNITPEVLEHLLQFYNLSRQEFIDSYKIQPLVYIPELPSSAKIVFVVVYTVIFLLALIGNSLVVYIVLRKRGIQTATNIFICSLAVSDLLICFFCIPFTLLQNISSEWLGGKSNTFLIKVLRCCVYKCAMLLYFNAINLRMYLSVVYCTCRLMFGCMF